MNENTVVYVSGLESCHDLGDGCCLFTFYVNERGPDGERRKAVSLRIVMPRPAIAPAMGMTAQELRIAPRAITFTGTDRRHTH